jgi:hypothetical protein
VGCENFEQYRNCSGFKMIMIYFKLFEIPKVTEIDSRK